MSKAPHKFFFILFTKMFQYSSIKKYIHFFLQKCSNLHEGCGMCWIERKIKFHSFPIFIVWVMVFFVLKTVNFRWIFTITRIIKIINLIFHSIQHNAHLSWKWGQNWGGRVCISLVILLWCIYDTQLIITYAASLENLTEKFLFDRFLRVFAHNNRPHLVH